MNNRQNGRRRRGGGGGGNAPRPMGQTLGGQAGNRLEVRVRGNAHQLLEKYKVLARDAHQAGDRVAAEYYLQHADHYFRVLNDSRIRQEEMRARRGIFDPLDDALDDEDGSDQPQAGDPRPERSFVGDEERAEAPQPRFERRERNRFDRPGRDVGRDPVTDPARGEAEGDLGRSPGGAEASGEQETLARLSDGEAALLAFGGAPVAEEGVPAAGADAPRPARRRGRPRRSEPAPADG